jgi:hypothetical protein
VKVFMQEGNDPYGATELVITLHDAGSAMNVWSLDVAGEERVFFEVTEDGDALDVVEAAFEARRKMKEEQ